MNKTGQSQRIEGIEVCDQETELAKLYSQDKRPAGGYSPECSCQSCASRSLALTGRDRYNIGLDAREHAGLL